MNTKEIETKGRKILEPYLETRVKDRRFVVTDKGLLSYELQKTVGDAVANNQAGAVFGVEFKIEAENKHGNLFLEDWSNMNFNPRNPGWMVTLKTDYLWYYFLDSDELFILKFPELFNWAVVDGNMYRYKRAVQRKHSQNNVTAGWCVPISAVKVNVWCELVYPRDELGLEIRAA